MTKKIMHKIIHKITALLLSIMMILSNMSGFIVYAMDELDKYQSDDYLSYELTKEGYKVLGLTDEGEDKLLEDDYVLTIPEELENIPIVGIENLAFQDKDVRVLNISSNIKDIGDGAFLKTQDDSIKLEEINITSNDEPIVLENSGESSFENNNLEKVPFIVKRIKDNSYRNNNITDFDLTLTEEIGEGALIGNDELKEVLLNEKTKYSDTSFNADVTIDTIKKDFIDEEEKDEEPKFDYLKFQEELFNKEQEEKENNVIDETNEKVQEDIEIIEDSKDEEVEQDKGISEEPDSSEYKNESLNETVLYKGVEYNMVKPYRLNDSQFRELKYNNKTPNVFSSLINTAYAAEANKRIEFSNAVWVLSNGTTQQGTLRETKHDSASISVKARFEYSISGTVDYKPGELQLEVPKDVFFDREGNRIGNVTLGVPATPTLQSPYSYYETDSSYIITNTKPLKGGSSGFFEMTISNIDSFDVKDLVTGNKTKPLYQIATIEVDGKEESSLKSNEITYEVDTKATISNAYKNTNYVYTSYPKSFPQELKPKNEDDYYYAAWTTYATPKATQPYSVSINDIVDPKVTEFTNGAEILGIKQNSNNSIVNNGAELVNNYRKTEHNDFFTIIYTAYPKSNFHDKNGDLKQKRFRLDNKVEYSMTSIDDKEITKTTDTATVYFTPPEFVIPTGHFYIDKYGVDEDLSGHYVRNYDIYEKYGYYDLSLYDLRNGRDTSYKYELSTRGYGYKWTLEDGKDPKDPANYGKIPYNIISTDEGDLTFGNLKLNKNEYDITELNIGSITPYDYIVATENTWGYQEGERGITSGNVYEGDWYYKEMSDSLDPLKLYGAGKDGVYTKYAEVIKENNNIKIQTFNGAQVRGTTIIFPTGIKDLKTEVKTTKAALKHRIFPTVKIYNNERIQAEVEKYFSKSANPVIDAQNTARLDVETGVNKKLMHINTDTGIDYLSSFAYGVNIDKTANYTEDARNQRAIIKYYSTMNIDTSATSIRTLKNAIAKGLYDEEKEGIWYDLLPLGVIADANSVNVSNGELLYSKVMRNYKNSGRDLLIVKTLNKPSYSTINNEQSLLATPGTRDEIGISFTAYYDYENLDSYGEVLTNNIAYQSLNDEFGNVPRYSGEDNDPEGDNHVNTKEATKGVEELLKGLALEKDDINNKTIYAKDSSRIVVNRAGLTGLNKFVKSDTMTEFTDGQEDREVNLYENQRYTYRIALKNDASTSTQNMKIYDSIDNYQLRDGNLDVGDTTWRGEFKDINLRPLIAKGIKPTIYYSTVPNLVVENDDDRTNNDLSNSKIWSTNRPDSKDITAIAIDLGDYTLQEGDSLYYEIEMKSPDLLKEGYVSSNEEKIDWYDTPSTNDSDEKGLDGGAHAYNSITMISDVINQGATAPQLMSTQAYTKVGLKPAVLDIQKEYKDGNNRDGKRNKEAIFDIYANDENIKTITLNSENEYKETLENVLLYDEDGNQIYYKFVETNIPDGYALSNNVETTDEGRTKVTLTNRYEPEKITINGKKTFSSDTVNIPNSVRLKLISTEGEQEFIVKPDADGNWNYSLEVFKNYNGKPLNYRIEEVNPEKGYFVPDYNGYNIHNEYKPFGDLVLSKDLQDTTPQSRNKEFDFKVIFKDKEGNIISEPIEYKKGLLDKGEINSGAVVTLKGGESIRFLNLPVGYTYEIREDNAKGFTAVDGSVKTGKIKFNEDNNVRYVNRYQSKGYTSLKLRKQLDGAALSMYQFIFEAYDENGKLIQAAGNNKENINFPKIFYTQKDLGPNGKARKVYTIKEKNMGNPGYTYDDKEIKVVVDLEDNGDGTINVTTDIKDDATFTFNNEYKASGELDITAYKFMERIKEIEGIDYEDFSFNLNLDRVSDSDGNSVSLDDIRDEVKAKQTINADKNGKVSFNKIPFNQYDVGKTFEFVVTEEDTGNKKVIYDDNSIRYFVTPVDNGNGTLGFNYHFVYDDVDRFKEMISNSISDETQRNKIMSEIEKVTNGVNDNDDVLDAIYQVINKKNISITPLFENKSENTKINVSKKIENGDPNKLFKFKMVLHGEDYEIPEGGFKNETKERELTKDLITWDIKDGVMTVYPDNNADIGYFELDGESKKEEFQSVIKQPEIQKIIFLGHNVAPKDSSELFRLSRATQIDFGKFDTSNVTNMSRMFYDSHAATLDLSNFDTSNVTNMSNMFSYSHAATLDLSNFDTSNVTNMNRMFAVSKATTLDLSNFDISNVKYMESMFSENQADKIYVKTENQKQRYKNEGKLSIPDENIIIKNPNTTAQNNILNNIKEYIMPTAYAAASSNVVDLSKKYTTITSSNIKQVKSDLQAVPEGDIVDVSGWDIQTNDLSYLFNNFKGVEIKGLNTWKNTSKVTNMGFMFYKSNAKELDLSNFDTSNVTNMYAMFYKSNAKELNLSNFDTSNVKSMNSMFQESKATNLDLSSFDTSNVTNMGHMFRESQATTLDLSSFDTSNVTNMGYMFYGSKATNLDLSSFDTSNVTSMYAMFYSSKATNLDLSSFDTSNVADMGWMFSQLQATNLDLSSFDTSNVTNMSYMFSNSQATNLDLNSFDTSNVTDMSDMFSSSKATTLDLSSFDTSNVTNMSYMFFQSQATNLDLSSFDTSNVTNMNYMFLNSQTTTLDLGDKFQFKTNANLHNPPNNTEYTGKWIKKDKSMGPYTSSELMANPPGMAGTWVWEKVPTEYTIVFDKNNDNATGSIPNVIAEKDKKVVIPTGGYNSRGQKLIGYSKNPNATTPEYKVGQPYTNIYNVGQSGTLYAVWEDVDKTTQFNGNEIIFYLYDGEEITFDDIPAGLSYEIYEETDDGWQVVDKTNDTGVTQPGEEIVSKFTNKYTHNEVNVEFRGRKYLDDNLSQEAYNFEIKNLADNSTQTVSSQNGIFTFNKKYTSAGTYKYKIREVAGSDNNIVYDNHVENITVKVSEVNGVLVADIVTDEDGIVFNNKTKTAQLNITKSVSSIVDENQEFDIEVFINGNRNIYKLKNDENVSIPLKYGDEYSIGEVNIPGGYALKEITNESGIIESDKVESTVYNEYISEANIEFNVKKEFINESGDQLNLSGNDFEFTLYDENGVILDKQTNDANGDVLFNNIQSYNGLDVGKTYKYTIRETSGSDSSIVYDNTAFNITVMVDRDKNGLIRVTQETVKNEDYENGSLGIGNQTLVFTNIKKIPDATKTNVDIKVEKNLDGNKSTDRDFTFILNDSDGNEIERKLSNNGEAIFNIEYSKPGRYSYEIHELNDNQYGILYDKAYKQIYVDVVVDKTTNKLVANIDEEVSDELVFNNQIRDSKIKVRKIVENLPEDKETQDKIKNQEFDIKVSIDGKEEIHKVKMNEDLELDVKYGQKFEVTEVNIPDNYVLKNIVRDENSKANGYVDGDEINIYVTNRYEITSDSKLPVTGSIMIITMVATSFISVILISFYFDKKKNLI